MPVRITCSHCNKRLKAKDELAGRRVKCPACGQVLTVPAEQPENLRARPNCIADQTPTDTRGVRIDALPVAAPRVKPGLLRWRLGAAVTVGTLCVVSGFAIIAMRTPDRNADSDSSVTQESLTDQPSTLPVSAEANPRVEERPPIPDRSTNAATGPTGGSDVSKEVDIITFTKAFADGEADKYKGFLVRGGGAAAATSTTVGNGGYASVFVSGKRPDGSFYAVQKTNAGSYNFNASEDRIFSVKLVFRESDVPKGLESGGSAFARDLGKHCERFQARFSGEYADVETSTSGQPYRKERVPVLTWEVSDAAPVMDSVKPQGKSGTLIATGSGPPRITKESLLGTWTGKLKDGTIEVEFLDKVALVALRVPGQFVVGRFAYEIDDTAGAVLIYPMAGKVRNDQVVAMLAKDGQLVLSGKLPAGTSTYSVTDTRIDRNK